MYTFIGADCLSLSAKKQYTIEFSVEAKLAMAQLQQNWFGLGAFYMILTSLQRI